MLSFHCQGYCITSHRELRLLLGFWFLETALRMMQSKHHSVCKRTFPLLPHWLSVYFASGQIVASQFRACVNNANMVLLILEDFFSFFAAFTSNCNSMMPYRLRRGKTETSQLHWENKWPSNASVGVFRRLCWKKGHDGKYLRKWRRVNGPTLDVEFHSLMCLSQA